MPSYLKIHPYRVASSFIVFALFALLTGLVIKHAFQNQAPVHDLINARFNIYSDTFTLKESRALINGHAEAPTEGESQPLLPISYSLATTTTTQLNSGATLTAIALHRSFGANIRQIALFVFSDAAGSINQVASGIAFQGDAEILKVEFDKMGIALNLNVISEHDLATLPHYEQKPTVQKKFRFTIRDDKVVPVE